MTPPKYRLRAGTIFELKTATGSHSDEDLAREMGLTAEIVRHLEEGRATVNAVTALSIVRILGGHLHDWAALA